MGRLLLYGFSLAALSSLPNVAFAQITGDGYIGGRTTDAQCSQYAQEAEQAASFVRKNSCGFQFEHPQWSEDGSMHERWCLVAQPWEVERERHNRQAQVYNCDRCRRYAREAIADVLLAVRFNCGWHPATWSPNEDSHFQWCMGLNDKFGPGSPMWKQASLRRDVLNACLHNKPAYCEAYAKEAVAEAKSVRSVGCDIHINDPKGVWSESYAFHLNSCKNNHYLESEGIRKTRSEEAAYCRQCRAYSDRAVKTLTFATLNHCKVSGARWSADANGHFGWCRANQKKNPGWLTSEAEERDKELIACGLNPDTQVPVLRSTKTVVNPAKPRSSSTADDTKLSLPRPVGVTTLEKALPQASIRRNSAGKKKQDAQSRRVGVSTGQSNLVRSNNANRAGPCGTRNRPCPTVFTPGLLEQDSGFAPQGPAGLGTGIGGGGGSAPRGGAILRQ